MTILTILEVMIFCLKLISRKFWVVGKFLNFHTVTLTPPSTTRKNGGKMRSRLVRPKIDVYQKTFFEVDGVEIVICGRKKRKKRGYVATYKSKCMSVESEKFNRIICRSKNNAFFLLR